MKQRSMSNGNGCCAIMRIQWCFLVAAPFFFPDCKIVVVVVVVVVVSVAAPVVTALVRSIRPPQTNVVVVVCVCVLVG